MCNNNNILESQLVIVCGVRLRYLAGSSLGSQLSDLVHVGTKQEEILFADLLSDLDIRTVQCSN